MNKRTASIVLLLAVMMLGIAGPTGVRNAGAQGMFFGAQRFPAIEVDGDDNLYLMMSVATAPASERRPHSQIFFTMSQDFGATWDNLPLTRNLSKSPGEAFGPSLAVSKSGKLRLHVSYHDNSNGTTQAYIISTKKKTKFRKPLNLTPHNGGAFAPRVALDSSGTVNVVWGDTKDGTAKVLFARSTDLGLTFNEPLNVSGSGGTGFDPEIAIDSRDAINVVWQDTAPGPAVIMFSRSTDGGASFSEPKRISTGSGSATEAAIATDSADRISVVWADESEGTSQAFYARSTDAGSTFSEPINVSSFSDGDIHKPTVVTFQNNVYVAFQNGDLFGADTIDNRQVFLVKSFDAGVSFGDSEQVSNANNNKGRAHSPALTVDSRGMIHMVWIDASFVGNDEGVLLYSNSSDGRRFSVQRLILAVL
ncbi:MAG TPA: sialidase family protein [Blastocatellia bacterium]|nr:sialidase family protein [Blastocatellia bacterium]